MKENFNIKKVEFTQELINEAVEALKTALDCMVGLTEIQRRSEIEFFKIDKTMKTLEDRIKLLENKK